MKSALLLPFMALSACASQGSFPSLDPRPAELDRAVPASPGAAIPTLSAEERETLREDLARARADLAQGQREIAAAERALAAALPAGRTAPVGSEPWANAQMLLSRLEDARGALEGIDARLVPALLMTDGLPDDDPDRAAVLAVRAELAAEASRATAADLLAEPSGRGG